MARRASLSLLDRHAMPGLWARGPGRAAGSHSHGPSSEQTSALARMQKDPSPWGERSDLTRFHPYSATVSHDRAHVADNGATGAPYWRNVPSNARVFKSRLTGGFHRALVEEGLSLCPPLPVDDAPVTRPARRLYPYTIPLSHLHSKQTDSVPKCVG